MVAQTFLVYSWAVQSYYKMLTKHYDADKKMEKEKKIVIDLDALKPMKKPYKMYKTIQTMEESNGMKSSEK